MKKNFEINGRHFRISFETIHGAEGFALSEWQGEGVGGRETIHDFGMPSEDAARSMAEDIARHAGPSS